MEETSLVARPAIGFKELKERMEARLKHLGITVKAIEEEEYCLIPMGGTLPKLPQRVLGIGGTGGMVHPSTGDPRYQEFTVVRCCLPSIPSKVCKLFTGDMPAELQ